MPTYRYQCESCGVGKTEFRPFEDREKPLSCQCGGAMAPIWHRMERPQPKETLDKYRNVVTRANVKDDVRKRAKEFFLDNEVRDNIEKVGVEAATRLGWIKDGKVVKKSDLK